MLNVVDQNIYFQKITTRIHYTSESCVQYSAIKGELNNVLV